VLSHQGGIGEAEHRWGVEQHEIELTAAGEIGHQLMHALGTEQASGIRRTPAGGDHAPVVVAVHALHDLAPVLALLGEQVAQTGEVVDPEAVMHLRFAQVRVDQQHPLAHFRERFGQQHIHQRFTFRRQGAGEGH